MSALAAPRDTPLHKLGRATLDVVAGFGAQTLFVGRVIGAAARGLPRRSAVVPVFHEVGVASLPVVLVTGAFIGMVLAVQSYDQLRVMRLENRLGSVINVSIVKELGPVLAATMLAGRVGSAMAAQLGTMKVTEQIDALKALGAEPIRHLVVPRVLACVTLVPLLTVLADLTGILGGWAFGTRVLGVDDFYYWHYTFAFIGMYDFLSGIAKSLFFGTAIGLIACHRGFACGNGADGVGKAATQAFVISFAAILGLDFLLGIVINRVQLLLWAQTAVPL